MFLLNFNFIFLFSLTCPGKGRFSLNFQQVMNFSAVLLNGMYTGNYNAVIAHLYLELFSYFNITIRRIHKFLTGSVRQDQYISQWNHLFCSVFQSKSKDRCIFLDLSFLRMSHKVHKAFDENGVTRLELLGMSGYQCLRSKHMNGA